MHSLKPHKHFFAWFSIRTQLLVLLIGIAGVLVVDRAREIIADQNSAVALAKKELLSAGQRGAQREAELIATTQAVLALARRDPDIRLDSPLSCKARFQATTNILGWLNSISLISKAGDIVCTNANSAKLVNIADRPYFQEALRTKRFVVSDFLIARPTGNPVIIAVLPKVSGGEVVSVYLAAIDAGWFSRMTRAIAGLGSADVLAVDGPGTVISTSAGLAHWSGKRLSDNRDLWTALNGADGVLETKVFDGTERLISHTRLPATKGLLLVMRSRADVLERINAQTWAVLAKIIAASAVGLLAVWFGGQFFVLKPLQALGAAAKRLGDGDLGARVDTRMLAPELATLGVAFNSMSSLLAQREDELKRANAALAELAATDGLTGIANKRRFDERLESEWRRACRDSSPISLIVMDVDHFKQFNDRYGHVAGDECLQRVGSLLNRQSRRPGDIAARTGGEEFAVLLPGAHMEDAVAIAESIRAAVRSLKIPHVESATGHVTASLGVATITPTAGQSVLALLSAADEALYRAKRSGRNRVVLHQPRIALAS